MYKHNAMAVFTMCTYDFYNIILDYFCFTKPYMHCDNDTLFMYLLPW